jgi:hypothetical protein
LLYRFWDIVADSRYSEHSILVSLFGDISKPVFVGFAEIIVRPDFIIGCFTLDALTGVPFVGFDPDSEDAIFWELFLSEVHGFSKFVVFLVEEIMQVAFYEDGLGYCFVVGFGGQDLFYFIINGIFLDFSEAEIGGVYRPLIGSLFLFSGIIIFV